MRKDSNRFEVTWEADDGYVGGSAPHYFEISASELPDEADAETLKSFFWEGVQEDFEGKVSPISEDEEAFVEWAKAKIAEREKENSDAAND